MPPRVSQSSRGGRGGDRGGGPRGGRGGGDRGRGGARGGARPAIGSVGPAPSLPGGQVETVSCSSHRVTIMSSQFVDWSEASWLRKCREAN